MTDVDADAALAATFYPNTPAEPSAEAKPAGTVLPGPTSQPRAKPPAASPRQANPPQADDGDDVAAVFYPSSREVDAKLARDDDAEAADPAADDEPAGGGGDLLLDRAKEAGMSDDQAAALAGKLAEQRAAWLDEILADELVNGGEGVEANLRTARAAIAQLDPDGELRELLDATGLGDHPTMARFAVRLGEALKNR